jgi:hypothetical protein
MIVTGMRLIISTSSKFQYFEKKIPLITYSLMNVISRMGTAHVTGGQTKGNDLSASPSLTPTMNKGQNIPVPPSLSTSALSVPGSVDTSTLGLSESQLRRHGLECLVAVLKSLVTWGTGLGTGTPGALSASDPTIRSRISEDTRRDAVTPDPSLDKMSHGTHSIEVTRQSTPDIVDDPGRFESAKQKKTSLLEGIKKFNFKPKRVSCWKPVHPTSIHAQHPFPGYRLLFGCWFYPFEVPPRHSPILTRNRRP